jgi:hypothetical protein
LSKVTAALEAGDGQKASKLALSFAILVDKSGVLERAAAAARTAPIVKGEVVDTEPEAPTPLRGDADWEQVAEILFTSGVLRCPRCDGRDDRRDDPPPLPQLPPGAPTRTATTRRTR